MRSVRRSRVLLACCVLALASISFFALTAPAAFAGPGDPVLSSPNPSPGATGVVPTYPTVAIYAAATANLNMSSSMRLDGQLVQAAWTFAEASTGTWEWDDYVEDYVWVPDLDYTQGRFAYTPRRLQNGPHTASVTILDLNGKQSTQSWSFTVGAPPYVSPLSPLDGAATTNRTPTISATVVDNYGTLSSTTMLVDGAPVAAHFAGSSTFTYTPSLPLSDGMMHTVTVTAVDSLGPMTVRSWSFFVNTGATLVTPVSPTVGSPASTWNPVVIANASDLIAINAPSVVRIDGASVPFDWQWTNPGHTSGTLSAQAPMLTDGLHTALTTLSNTTGTTVTRTWNFTVAAPPRPTIVTPEADSVAATDRPLISAVVQDNGDGAISGALSVDGSTIASAYNPATKTLSSTPSSRLSNDATHTATVVLTDAGGNSSTTSWSFRVQTYTSMPVTGTCTSCHLGFPQPAHPMANCAGCHVDGPIAWPASGDGHGPEYLATFDCAYCHNPAYPTIPRHPENIDGAHLSIAGADCLECHQSSLTVEHYRYSVGGARLNCATCHSSTNPDVQTAIATGDTNCLSCHGSVDHEAAHGSTSSAACFAAGCHDTSRNLVTVHSRYIQPGAKYAEYTSVCALCHFNNDPNRIDWDTATTACESCHSAPHSRESVGHAVSAPASTECTACHGTDIPAVHGAYATPANCDFCHSDPTNWTKTADCLNCHASKSPVAANHYPAATHTATEIAGCAACHSLELAPEHAKASSGSITCAGCHTSSKFQSLTRPWDDSCVACHATKHDGMDAAHTPLTENAGCMVSGCHAAGNDLAGLHSNATTTVAGVERSSCAVCHTDGVPANKNCLTCHPDMFQSHYHVSSHAGAPTSQLMSVNGVSYGTWQCSACHNTELGPEHQKSTSSSSASGCAACHPSPRNTLLPSWNHNTCVQGGCHVVATATQMHLNIDSAHARLHNTTDDTCFASGCHADTDLAAIHSAATTTVAGQPQSACGVCHTAGVPASKDCATCHNTSNPHADLNSAHTATLGSASMTILGTSFGSHQCSECHPSAVLTTVHPGACSTCHPSPKNTVVPWNKSCATGGCHSVGTSAQHAQLDSAHVVSAQPCTASGCHTGAGNAAAIHANHGCQVCHGPGITPTTDCSACHDMTGGGHANLAAAHTATNWKTSTYVTALSHYNDSDGAPDVSADLSCFFCHETNNLMVVHNNNCQTCHSGATASFTTWNKTCQQGACHPTKHTTPPSGGEHGGTGLYCSCHEINGGFDVPPSAAPEQMCGACHAVADTIAPTTTSDAAGAYTGPATIHLTATDNEGGSGVAATYYKIDGGAQTAGTTAVVSSNGAHSLEFWSVDGAGNPELPHHTANFTITINDSTAPSTTSDAIATYSNSATIHLTATDNIGGSGVKATYYKLDGGGQTTGTTISTSALGAHTLEFWSIDNANNTETPHKSANFTIRDTIAPTTTSDAVSLYTLGATIHLTATDNVNGSGVGTTYYRLDGGTQTAGTTISTSALGAHTLEFWSVDNATNVETPHKSANFTVTAGMGTVTFDIWNDAYDEPAFENWIAYVRTGSGQIVAVANSNNGQPVSVSVPVSAQPYTADMTIIMYNGSDTTNLNWTGVLIDTPGKSVTLTGSVWDE